MNSSVIQGCFPNGFRQPVAPRPAPMPPPIAQRATMPRGAVFPPPRPVVPQQQQPVIQRFGAGTAMRLPDAMASAANRSIGQPLQPAVRQMMESLFRTSFADVRVHVGPHVSAIGATSFTQGSNIHFAPGQYAPDHGVGRQRLAYELAHVVQQKAGRARNPFGSGVAVVQDAALEAEAQRLSLRAAASSPRSPLPIVQRQVAAPYGRRSAAHSGGVVQPGWKGALAGMVGGAAGGGLLGNRFGDRFGRAGIVLGGLVGAIGGYFAGEAVRPGIRPERNPMTELTAGINLSRFNLQLTGDRKRLIDELFERFVSYGFRYDAGQGSSGMPPEGDNESPDFMGNDKRAADYMQNKERFGSCITLAMSFARLLTRCGIEEASAEYVVLPNRTVLVHLPNFIDPSVTSNVEYEGRMIPHYFTFESHAAVKVRGIDQVWDPTAKSTYQSVEDHVDCDLKCSGVREDFQGRCNGLSAVVGQEVSDKTFHLVVHPNRKTGGLSIRTLEPGGKLPV